MTTAMSPEPMVALAFFVVGIAASILVPRMWRNELRLEWPQGWWAFGEEAWIGFMKVGPLLILTGWLLIAGAIAPRVLPPHPPGSLV